MPPGIQNIPLSVMMHVSIYSCKKKILKTTSKKKNNKTIYTRMMDTARAVLFVKVGLLIKQSLVANSNTGQPYF
jgi:hypothetical protein